MEYKIAAVSEKVDTWTSSYGEMKTYYVKFEGQTEAIKINQKPDTPAPEVGQTLTGDIVEDKFGKKFKKQSAGFSGGSAGGSSKPIDHDSMYRCNALNNAAEVGGEVQEVLANADKFYAWLKNENKGYEAAKATAEAIKEEVAENQDTDEIDLDDIPF